MTVRQLAKDLSRIKEELQDKDVKIIFPNGELNIFDIKFLLVDKMNMDKTKENVECIVLQ
jgi:hypothetical protein